MHTRPVSGDETSQYLTFGFAFSQRELLVSVTVV